MVWLLAFGIGWSRELWGCVSHLAAGAVSGCCVWGCLCPVLCLWCGCLLAGVSLQTAVFVLSIRATFLWTDRLEEDMRRRLCFLYRLVDQLLCLYAFQSALVVG